MKRTMHRIMVSAFAAAVLATGSAGSASAGGGTTFCGYQETGGTAQWERRYVGNRQCPATDVYNGVQGGLVYSEYIA